jgi:hypothetical protein
VDPVVLVPQPDPYKQKALKKGSRLKLLLIATSPPPFRFFNGQRDGVYNRL